MSKGPAGIAALAAASGVQHATPEATGALWSTSSKSCLLLQGFEATSAPPSQHRAGGPLSSAIGSRSGRFQWTDFLRHPRRRRLGHSPRLAPIRLQAGDFFGEMSLLDGKERSATIEADTEVLLLAIARPDFMKMLESEPPMAVAILKELATRLRSLNETHTS